MLKGKLIHPEILDALGKAGHGSKILIADGNYPFATAAAPRARQCLPQPQPRYAEGNGCLAGTG